MPEDFGDVTEASVDVRVKPLTKDRVVGDYIQPYENGLVFRVTRRADSTNWTQEEKEEMQKIGVTVRIYSEAIDKEHEGVPYVTNF